MKQWYVDRVDERATRRCGRCGHALAWVDQIGWIDLAPGDAYDMCEADPYGNHLAEPTDSGPEGRAHGRGASPEPSRLAPAIRSRRFGAHGPDGDVRPAAG